jgi:two-component system LytT family response regulator
MEKLKAILVDDEQSARDVLENLLSRFCPEVSLLGKCADIPEAVELIKKVDPDIVFLDIRMPNYAGFEIVNFFAKPDFDIIFVTAYEEYAVRAFEVAAVDYLLKPIDIDRLKLAVDRVKAQQQAQKQIEQLSILSDTLKGAPVTKIIVSDKGQQHVVEIDSVVAIEAMESYCIIHSTSRKYTVSKNLKHFENTLAGVSSFMRVHKSWIINRPYLVHYSKSELTLHLKTGLVARLSKYKKVEFEAAITK